MKNPLILFVLVIMCSSCSHMMDDREHICSQLQDTGDIELYSFVPFSEEEAQTLTYAQKLERRQIPDVILSNMTAKSLFFQYVTCELSGGMYIYNSAQRGFIVLAGQLNMLPELLNRSDAGKVLMDLLEKTDLSKLNGTECLHSYLCLERILVQPEIIAGMTDRDENRFIELAERVENTIVQLSKTNGNWSNPESLAAILFGFGNVMLKHEYKPFIQLMDSNAAIGGLMTGDNLTDRQCIPLINDCIKNFKKITQ